MLGFVGDLEQIPSLARTHSVQRRCQMERFDFLPVSRSSSVWWFRSRKQIFFYELEQFDVLNTKSYEEKRTKQQFSPSRITRTCFRRMKMSSAEESVAVYSTCTIGNVTKNTQRLSTCSVESTNRFKWNASTMKSLSRGGRNSHSGSSELYGFLQKK